MYNFPEERAGYSSTASADITDLETAGELLSELEVIPMSTQRGLEQLMKLVTMLLGSG